MAFALKRLSISVRLNRDTGKKQLWCNYRNQQAARPSALK